MPENYSRPVFFKSIIILVFLVAITIVYYGSYNKAFLESIKPFAILKRNISWTDKRSQFTSFLNRENNSLCEPLYSHDKQYYAKINEETYPKIVPLLSNKSINFECLNDQSISKVILMWNGFFNNKFYSHTEGNKGFIDKKCPVTNCYITADKKRLNEADLVITHMRDAITGPPKTRPANQRWVFLLYESPIHANIPAMYNGFYNLTSTYLINSDFPGFYTDNGFTWEKNSAFDIRKNYLNSKTEFAAAVISNCNVQSGRKEYIEKMRAFVKVDVFGKCGKPCKPKETCKQTIAKKYKFYLAFENSICKDYITEKFFGILEYDIIPVVMGGGQYEKYIPKSGYINVKDYESPKKLTDYMKYLSRNETAYNSYFKWKQHVVFGKEKYGFLPICEMCIKLNLERYFGIQRSVIKNINKYWSSESNCAKSPSKIVY